MTPRFAGLEDVPALAALHAASFERPWSEADIAELVASPGAFALMVGESAFILGRAIAGEGEIITLAVEPAARRSGLGRLLVEAATEIARSAGAESLFLEVAAGNAPAVALYEAAGFERAGLRPGYYADGQDALVMRLALNR